VAKPRTKIEQAMDAGALPEEAVRAPARAWDSYPLTRSKCKACGGRLRRMEDLDEPGVTVEVFMCEQGHGSERSRKKKTEDAAPPVVEGEEAARAPRAPRKFAPVAKVTSTGARVIFHELAATPLYDMDLETISLMNPRDQDLEGALVKVTAELRPSERDGFNTHEIKRAIRAHGAREVVVVTRALHEAPDTETKKEVATAPRPEDAITAWFDGLPIPAEDREAAKAKALEILASEGG